jgi:putative permease
MNQKTLIQIAVTATITIVLALFIHDSGSTLLGFLQLGGRALFLPLFLAIVLYYVLDPAINYFERKMAIGRVITVLALYTALFSAMILFFSLFFPKISSEFIQLRKEIPLYAQNFLEALAHTEMFLKKDLGVFGQLDFVKSISEFVDSRSTRILILTVGTIRTGFSLVILVPLFSFLLLIDGHKLKRAFIQQVPNRYFETTLTIFHQIHKSLGNFIRGRFYECATVGFIALVGLYVIGLPYFWLFALIVGITNLVPVFGPLAGILFTGFSSFLITGNWLITLLAICVLLLAQLIDNVVLIPVLIRKTASIHILTGLIAIILGGQVFGIVGMIVAIPLVSILKLIILEVMRHWQALVAHREFFHEPLGERVIG